MRLRAADPETSGPVRLFFRGAFCRATPLVYPHGSAFEDEPLEIVLDSLRRFADGSVDSSRIDAEASIGDSVIAGLREIGLFGITIPEEHGGSGFGNVRLCRAMEEASAIDASISFLLGGHLSIGAKGLLLHGTEEQKERFLPELASGERIASFALSEPGAGSDVRGMTTLAGRSSDGRAWTIDGRKSWIANGGFARLFTVLARTPMARGREDDLTAFLVPREAPGLSIGREEEKLGLRGSSTAEVLLEGVEVGDDLVLGEPGRGFAIAMEVLNYGRLGLSAGCLGQAKAIRERAAAHARERKQFGRPIAGFEMVKEKLAEMSIDVFSMESLVYATAALVDGGFKDFSIEAAICKVFASEALWRVVNHALEIAGGSGLTREYPYERFLRDARMTQFFEGTNEVLRRHIAMAGLKGPRREVDAVRGKLSNPIAALPELITFLSRQTARAFVRDTAPAPEAELRREASALEQAVKWLGQSSVRTLVRHGDEFVERQLAQSRLADAAIDCYAMAAVLARSSAILARSDAGEAEKSSAAARARLFCARAFARVKRALDAIDSGDDGLVVRVADDREP